MEETKTSGTQKACLFTNWTSEDFAWTYGGVAYTFKAGQSIYLQDYLARHFTKHLVDKELNREKLPTNHHTRGEFERKCYGEAVVQGENKEKLESELLNVVPPVATPPSEPEPVLPPVAPPESPEQNPSSAQPQKFCDSCDSKGVRHLKSCVKYIPIIRKK